MIWYDCNNNETVAICGWGISTLMGYFVFPIYAFAIFYVKINLKIHHSHHHTCNFIVLRELGWSCVPFCSFFAQTACKRGKCYHRTRPFCRAVGRGGNFRSSYLVNDSSPRVGSGLIEKRARFCVGQVHNLLQQLIALNI